MKQLIKQFCRFIMVSGIGFIIDFSAYYYLTKYLVIPIAYANMISAVPAVTWVFIFSTRKIFQKTNSKYSLWTKYVIYIAYQFALLLVVSYLAQEIYNILYTYLFDIKIIGEYLKVLCKCIITPITMICNFIFMKYLTEKA